MTYRPLPLTAFAFAAFCSVYSGSARADEPSKSEPPKTQDQARAAELFSEGRALTKAGNYAEACPKFEQSLRLNVGVGVQFNLADCWEHIGRVASAQALFQGAAATARAAGQSDRAEVAQARAEALNPRLIRMLIDVKSTDRGLVIRSNHVAVDPKQWGTATSVDAGEYLIEASAPGKKPWSARLIVPAAATDVVSITIPPLEDAPPDAATPAVAPLAAAEAKPVKALPPVEPPPSAAEQKDNRRTVYALTFAGVGVVGVGLGTVFGLEFRSKNNDAKTICPSSVGCSRSDIDHHAQLLSDAKSARTLSFVGFGVGAASLIAAGVLYFSPSAKSEQGSWSAVPFVTADGTWGAAASGRF